MQEQRRQIQKVIYVDWRELLTLIEQGWVTHVTFVASRVRVVTISYNVVTNIKDRYVWRNGSRDAFEQNMELVTAYKARADAVCPNL